VAADEKPDRDNTRRRWQKFVSLLLGAVRSSGVVAGLVSGVIVAVVTNYSGYRFDYEAESRREHTAETALLSALQAEIETNIIGLKAVFSHYESAVTNGDPLQLRKVPVSATIFKENAGKISEVRDLGFVSEIVAFYAGLEQLNSWRGMDSPRDAAEREALRHASQLANLLHASLYLQARLAARTEDIRRSLSTPSFNESQQNVLRRTQTFRQNVGAKVPKDRS